MKIHRSFRTALPLATGILLALPLAASADQITKARATLHSCADPTVEVGSALLVELPSSEAVKVVSVFITVRGLAPGKHAVHIHEAGLCTPVPTCGNAGSHLDMGPAGANTPVTANHPYHSGDLVNLNVGSDGRGTLLATTTRVALTEPEGRPADRPLSILDANGSALVIHLLPDLYCPDPLNTNCAGGGRVACGVIEPVN